MIIISPYAKPLRNGEKNPKDYPYWKELIELIDYPLTQIGVPGETPLVEDFRTVNFKKLKELIEEMDFFISVDNFFPHFCHYYKKRGIVLFSKSNPEIFGYPENLNLLKDPEHLRPDQFYIWEQCTYDENAYLEPDKIAHMVNTVAKGYYSVKV